MRWESLGTRLPPTRAVVPSSPVRVYTRVMRMGIPCSPHGNPDASPNGCDRSIPKTCAVDHLCQCWRFAYLIDMRVKSNGWGANDFQPSRWEEMSYQVNVKHASRHTTKMRIPQALDF